MTASWTEFGRSDPEVAYLGGVPAVMVAQPESKERTVGVRLRREF